MRVLPVVQRQVIRNARCHRGPHVAGRGMLVVLGRVRRLDDRKQVFRVAPIHVVAVSAVRVVPLRFRIQAQREVARLRALEVLAGQDHAAHEKHVVEQRKAVLVVHRAVAIVVEMVGPAVDAREDVGIARQLVAERLQQAKDFAVRLVVGNPASVVADAHRRQFESDAGDTRDRAEVVGVVVDDRVTGELVRADLGLPVDPEIRLLNLVEKFPVVRVPGPRARRLDSEDGQQQDYSATSHEIAPSCSKYTTPPNRLRIFRPQRGLLVRVDPVEAGRAAAQGVRVGVVRRRGGDAGGQNPEVGDHQISARVDGVNATGD